MKRVLLIFSLFFLGSCTPYPKYRPPCASVPESWKGEVSQETPVAVPDWWAIFQDERLNELEVEAMTHNYSLEIAYQNWMQARMQACVARAALFPQASLNPSYFKQDSLFFIQGLPLFPAPVRVEQAQYTVPLQVSYEVDLWNQLRNIYNSDLYNAQAQKEAYNNLLLSISADVATHYFTIRGLDSELVVLEQNIKIRQDALDITQSRYEGGLVNFIDVSQSQTALATVKADYENTLRLRIIEEDALATLLGQPASDFSNPNKPLLGPPPSVPAGVPSTLLARRPDIREAERQMAAAHAQIAVQVASFFPSLNIVGQAGYLSPLWHNLLDWKARFWSLAVNVAQVVFDGGAIQGNVNIAKAVFLQNAANYQQTVLRAFQEVEDALADIEYEARQVVFLEEAVKAAQTTLDLSMMRYTNGLVLFLEVVDAERTLFENQRNLVKVQSQQYLSTIFLIKALGGGWESLDSCE